MTPAKIPLPEFHERLPWWGGDLQTARNALTRDYAELGAWPGFRIHFVAANGDRLSGVLHEAAAREMPLVVLVHGLTGCEDSAYIRASARRLLESKFGVFRFNLRGAGPSRADCRAMYHAGRSDDLRLALEGLISAGHGRAGVFAVGYSLGANLLLKYLGEAGKDALISRAVAVSSPIDLAAASTRLEARRNCGYHRWLLDRMKLDWQGGPLEIAPEQIEALQTAATIREFDNGLVAPLNGFADAADYYVRNGARQFLARITTPTLVLHADNDPLIPVDAYLGLTGLPETMRVELTRGGGHVGFHGRQGRWHDEAALMMFKAG